MRKTVGISGCIILIICFVITRQIFKPNTISNKTKNQIENSISSYLANNETFNSEIPVNMDIKFDKKADIYIVTVTFENTSKKMNIFVSKLLIPGGLVTGHIIYNGRNTTELKKIILRYF